MPDATALPERLTGRSIALIGLMGAGKTSIGRRLAARLGLPFRDADAEIELAAGCTISELFARYGEREFREGERRVIRRLLAGDPLVLATGGGAFMDPQTRLAIRGEAVSVWLRAELPTLLRRVATRTNRPLLAGPGARRGATAADGSPPSRLCRGRYRGGLRRRAARRHHGARARCAAGLAAASPAGGRPQQHLLRRADRRGAAGPRRRPAGPGAAAEALRGNHRRPCRRAASARAAREPRGDRDPRRQHRGARRRGVEVDGKLCRRGRAIAGPRRRAAHGGGGAGRRRGRRPRGLRRRQHAARPAVHPDPDIAAGTGRFQRRRQDRHQHAPRQEPGGRLPPAAPGAGRHFRPRKRCPRAS